MTHAADAARNMNTQRFPVQTEQAANLEDEAPHLHRHRPSDRDDGEESDSDKCRKQTPGSSNFRRLRFSEFKKTL